MAAIPDLIDLKELKAFNNLELLASQIVEGFIMGLHKSPFHGYSVEFAEHRLYNQGESTRHVDWRLFGRTDRLFTKKYEQETNLRCQLVVDTSSSMLFPAGQPTKLDFSIFASAALANIISRQRDALGLTLFHQDVTEHLPAKGSPQQYKRIFDTLARLQSLQPSTSFSSNPANVLHDLAERLPRRSLVIIFSDLFASSLALQDDIASGLQHLKYNLNEVIIMHTVHAPLETEFDYPSRPHVFVDLESGQKVRVNPAEMKEQYLAQVQKQLADIQEICNRLKISYHLADIHKGFHAILTAYLIRRKQWKG